MARNGLKLPIKATLTATRKGGRVAFVYTETPAVAHRAQQIAVTKKTIEMLDPGMLRGLKVSTTPTTIAISGTVSTTRFGELMTNEFSCWQSKDGLEHLQRMVNELHMTKLAEAAVGADASKCLAHAVLAGNGGMDAGGVVMWNGASIPLCAPCMAVAARIQPPTSAP